MLADDKCTNGIGALLRYPHDVRKGRDIQLACKSLVVVRQVRLAT